MSSVDSSSTAGVESTCLARSESTVTPLVQLLAAFAGGSWVSAWRSDRLVEGPLMRRAQAKAGQWVAEDRSVALLEGEPTAAALACVASVDWTYRPNSLPH